MMIGGENSTFSGIDPEKYEKWYRTKEGKFFDRLEKELIIEMVNPIAGEKALEIGCGTGHFLRWLKGYDLKTTGIDASEKLINYAKKLDEISEYKKAEAKNLPFKDKSFDIVLFITTLEFLNQPEKALQEAMRVSGNRIFIGLLNKFSLLSLKRKIKGLFKKSVYDKARFYSVFQIKKMIKNINKNSKIETKGLNKKSNFFCVFSPFVGILIEIKEENE
jgi:ubiquinone/menaquinone biosynthesis C-methylase UbiE